MAGPFEALWRMARARAPIAVVLYSDSADRDEWILEVEILLGQSNTKVTVTANVADFFDKVDAPLILVPEDGQEPESVRRLSVGRDRLLRRTAPAVLFLRRGGRGMDALAAQPALDSFLQGAMTVDPTEEEEIDVRAERNRFEEATGCSPEQWLDDYRTGSLPDSLETSLRRLRALLLTEKPS